jgi:AAA+ ATPase superfamily predicted ATPase
MEVFYDVEDLKRYRTRKRKQREYQASYRERLKDDGTPDREDIAAAFLRGLLRLWAAAPDNAGEFRERVLDEMGCDRFNRDQAAKVLDAMIQRERSKQRRRG